ncbi:MAG TPA: AAA family ATPase [Chloroflexota bacterium]|nr:AAA family ATPase [Chloroflexota bacterium]
MLKQVTARNWRAFDAVAIDLRPGLNVLLGPNGAGKTSLLEAAAFALAGAPATLSDAKQMVRVDGQPVDVAVALELDGTGWEVSRALGAAGHQGTAALRRGNTTAAEGRERVAAKLEELLGVPSDFYLRILYMPEGDVYRFLTNPPLAALDAHLQRVLGLEQLKLIDQAAGRVKREIDRQQASLTPLAEQVARRDQALAAGRARWSGDPIERRDWLEDECERLSAARVTAARERHAAADAMHAVERRLAELEQVDRELAPLAASDPTGAYLAAVAACGRLELAVKRLDSELGEATARQRALGEQRRALAARGPAELAAEDPSLAALLAETATAVQELDAALMAAGVERQAAAERARALRASAPADLVADDAALRARRDERAARLREIDAALAGAAVERQQVQESTAFLTAHAPGAGTEPTCPVCRQPLPEALRQRLLAENGAREVELAERVAALQAERAAAVAAEQAEAEALKQRLLEENAARAAKAEERERALQAERQAREDAVRTAAAAVRQRLLAAHDADAQALGDRIAALSAERQTERAALEAAEVREGAALKARQRLDALTARRQELLPGEASPDSLRAEHEELIKKEATAREQEAMLGKALAEAQEELATLHGYLNVASMAGRSPEDLAAARVALARRELLADLFAAATKATITRLQRGALAEAYDAVARAWEEFSGWAGARLEPDAKGKRLAVRRDGRSLELAQLSGGERAAFLALLHAYLGRHFGRGGFLLLDEPLEHLDAANGRKLLQHLVRACAAGTLSQVVIATVEADVVRAAIRDGEAHVITLPPSANGRA